MTGRLSRGGVMARENAGARGREKPRLSEMLGTRTRIALAIYLTVLMPYYLFMIFNALKPGLHGILP